MPTSAPTIHIQNLIWADVGIGPYNKDIKI